MPLYDYQCKECEDMFESFQPYERKKLPCTKCTGIAYRKVTVGGIQAFDVQTFEDLHLDDNLKEIRSKEELAKECHRQGLYAKQLMGSDKYERIMRGEY